MQSMPRWQGKWATGDLAVAVTPDHVSGAGCLNAGTWACPNAWTPTPSRKGSKGVALRTPNFRTGCSSSPRQSWEAEGRPEAEVGVGARLRAALSICCGNACGHIPSTLAALLGQTEACAFKMA